MKKQFFFNFIIIPIFRLFDVFIPKSNQYWGFCVHHFKSDQFIENQRAVFEIVKNDENIRKIIFTRDDSKDFYLENPKNTHILRLDSFQGLYYILRCRVILVTHSISMDFSVRYPNRKFSIIKLILSKRVVVNLWHGIPLKRLLALTNPKVKKVTNRVKFSQKERSQYSGLIASSNIDSFAIAAMFYPIKYENVWTTGLPRNDFLFLDEPQLPLYIAKDIARLREIKKDKKLIVYAPTYRQTHIIESSSYYQFSPEEMLKLKELLIKHNAILGFRMHYFRNSTSLFNMESYIDQSTFFDLGHSEFKEIAAVIRCSDMVITDYSGVFIDAIYTDKPVFSFAYDLDEYDKNQDGTLYDLDIIFPSAISRTFDELLESLEDELINGLQPKSSKYITSKKFFFKNIDAQNSQRVVEHINMSLKSF